MNKIIFTILAAFCCISSYGQVAINTDGTPVTDPVAMFEIKKNNLAKARIRTTNFHDTAQLEFSNRNSINQGTDILFSLNKEEGLLISARSDFSSRTQDSIMAMKFSSGRTYFGLNIKNPTSVLHVHDHNSASTTLRITNNSTGVIGINGLALNINGSNASITNAESGSLNFGTNNFAWGGFSSAGNFGVGTFSPSEKLGVSGNIVLTGSNKGIILDGQDRPLITRGFDAFTSGNYTGLGRWGLFMEPSRLTLGIPSVSGKVFEFATYNANSTRNTILNIGQTGSVTRPATNNANLLPVAFGTVDGTVNPPIILNGTGNFSVTKPGRGFYSLDVTDENITDASHTIIVTVIRNSVSNGTFAWATPRTTPPSGGFLVKTGDSSDQKFSFLIYKAF